MNKRSFCHRRQRRRWVPAIVLGAIVWSPPAVAVAHPLGNFTTNQYVGLHVEPDRVTIDYVLDLAEIPASQHRRDIDRNDDQRISEGEQRAFADSQCRRVNEALTVDVSGRALRPAPGDRALSFPEGEAGLPTLRLECRFHATAIFEAASVLEIDNGSFPDRIGWHEIVLTTTGLEAVTDLPSESLTARLTEYPDDLLSSPVNVRTASATLTPSPGAARGTPPPSVDSAVESRGTPVDALASLVSPSDGPPAAPIAMLVAVGLGVLHALAPGHGKTVMAAYLVGSRGTVGQAVGLGLAVAISHTAGVLALGIVTLIGTAAFAAEDVFPLLSTLSGLIIAAIGVWMLIRWLRETVGQSRHSGDNHHHAHHSHEGAGHTHAVPDALDGKSGWKVLASMGLAGGLVPSTSAVVLLLAAVNLGRVPLGIALIGLFGLGMAATLVGVGFALVKASDFGMSRWGHISWIGRLRRILTPVAAIVVMAVGVFLTASSGS